MPNIGGMFRDPRIAFPAVTAGSVILVGGGSWLIFDNWLIAMVVALAVALAVLVVMLLTTLRAQDRETVLARGLEEPALRKGGVRGNDVAEGFGAGAIDAGFARALGEIRRSRLGSEGIYALPWLMVIGESGAGKTSALRVSGLDLPPDQAYVAADRSTTDCDWWLTNQAVVLDTTGRYLAAEESDPGWIRLLKLLRQRRAKGPLDGLVIAVPIPTLIGTASDLRERARVLRRRINEITDTLEFDVPIYVLVTKADLIEGFTDVVAVLPPERLREALGWTNGQRDFSDAGEIIVAGLAQVRDRIEGLVSEMVLRAPSTPQKRRIFLFPQEFEAASEAVASFIGHAFAPSVYGEVPFLRGVYFASAKREGNALSPTLRRLGQEWAAAGLAPEASPDGLFLYDVFREIVIGDRDLAIPARWMGKRTRRVLVGISAAVSIATVIFATITSLDRFRDIRTLREESKTALRGASSLASLARLRETIERGDPNEASVLGLASNGSIARERAIRTYLWGFGREFEGPTKTRLSSELRSLDRDAFGALATLALDVSWLGSRADGSTPRPDLLAYAPISRGEADAAAFQAGYDAYVRWLPDDDRNRLIDQERDAVGNVAGKLLDLGRLDAWCERQQSACPPIRLEGFESASAPAAEDAETVVPGAYTRRIWDGLVRDLVAAVERAGGAPSSVVAQFRDGYAMRYDESWRRFLMGTPTQGVSVASASDSPYLSLLGTIEQNVHADVPRSSTPAWVATLESVRRNDAREGEQTPPPWQRYLGALKQVEADVVEAESQPGSALESAKALESPESSFRRALTLIRELVPLGDSPRENAKLREILEAPIYAGGLKVFENTMVALDQKWKERIAEPFNGPLDPTRLRELYAPGEGALDVFAKESLGPFYADGHSRPILGDRGLPFGESWLHWMESAESVKRSLFGGGGGSQIIVRMEGVPSRVVNGAGLFVTKRELRVTCALDVSTFTYQEGTGSHAFAWTPDCQDVSLRVWARTADGYERELLPKREWSGPMAFPNFLRDAQPVGSERYQWHLSYDGAELIAEYRLRSGDGLIKVAHTTPPMSVRE